MLILMTTIKTSDLTGAALDWAVCMAQGLKPEDIYISMARWHGASLFRRNRDEDGNLDGSYTTGPELLFSRKWEAGGPIIERENISVGHQPMAPAGSKWYATNRADAFGISDAPLIAAMRCYVASKLGDAVEVPDELTT